MKDLTSEFEPIIDHRGFIQDLVVNTQIKAVTHIYSYKDKVRGDHYHKETEQYNYVASGSLMLATRNPGEEKIRINRFEKGSFFLIETSEHHAMKFIEDSLIVVFTIGPRAGKEYETDTYRLLESLFSKNQ